MGQAMLNPQRPVKSLKRNAAYNMVKTVSSIAFPLITFPYASRVLLPEGIGMVNFGASIVSYFSLIATLGITTHAARECSLCQGDRESLGRVSSEIFSINMCTTLLAYALLAVTLLLFRGLDAYRELIVLQSTTILLAVIGCDWLNMAMEDFRFITLRTVGFQLLSLVLLFALVHTPDDYMTYAAISVVASAGANVVNIWYRRRYCKVRLTTKVRWRYHVGPIIMLFVMLLAQTVFNNVDITMLGLMRGNHEVGIYSTAYKVSNLISQLVFSLIWVMLPQLTQLFSRERFNEVNALLRKVLGFYVTLGFPLAVGGFMVADDAIVAFAGREFADSAPVFRILLLSFVLNLFGGGFLGNSIMLPSKSERHFMVACVLAAVANVALNALVIPLYGSAGAAATTTVCAAVILIYLTPRVDKRIRIDRVGGVIASPLVGCVAIVCVCLACGLVPNMWVRLACSICGSVVAYSAVMVATRNEFARGIVVSIRRIFTG